MVLEGPGAGRFVHGRSSLSGGSLWIGCGEFLLGGWMVL